MSTCSKDSLEETVADPRAHLKYSEPDAVTLTVPLLPQSALDHDFCEAEHSAFRAAIRPTLHGDCWEAESDCRAAIHLAHHHEHADKASVDFPNTVLSHPAFYKSLKAQEILNVKRVCRTWADCFDDNNNITTIIANARRKDDNHDWYFPLISRKEKVALNTEELNTEELNTEELNTEERSSWSWTGIWHPAADRCDRRQLQSLPPLDYLPPEWLSCNWYGLGNIVASSGGLFLLHKRPNYLDPWAPLQYWVRSNNTNIWLERFQKRWNPLMVVNPLTKAFRVLPTAHCEDPMWHLWGSRSVQIHMLVHDEANFYEVIKVFRTCVLAYNSTTDSWKCSVFPRPLDRRPHDQIWGYHQSSAWVGRRLFVATIQMPQPEELLQNPLVAGVLQVDEINVEVGDWKAHNCFPLRKWQDWIQIRGVKGDVSFDKRVLRNVVLVECMGHIFAVIPARLDEFLHPLDGNGDRQVCWKYPPLDYKYMPLQFYIFQLQGESLVYGVLRVETSSTIADYDRRRQYLFEKTRHQQRAPRNWFSCVAKGSVIWVSWEDYLLQFDVVSGHSQTHIVPTRGLVERKMRLENAYRPSFHMKP